MVSRRAPVWTPTWPGRRAGSPWKQSLARACARTVQNAPTPAHALPSPDFLAAQSFWNCSHFWRSSASDMSVLFIFSCSRRLRWSFLCKHRCVTAQAGHARARNHAEASTERGTPARVSTQLRMARPQARSTKGDRRQQRNCSARFRAHREDGSSPRDGTACVHVVTCLRRSDHPSTAHAAAGSAARFPRTTLCEASSAPSARPELARAPCSPPEARGRRAWGCRPA